MSKHEDGHLHEPTGQFWYNSKTGEVEDGPQSLAVDRVGPFPTREEAARAPEISPSARRPGTASRTTTRS